MANLDDLLSSIPFDQLAAKLGVDPTQAEELSRRALPALVGGMEANAHDPGGAASLSSALQGHGGTLVDGGIDLDDVDPTDGAKIVQHVFGSNQDQIISTLGGGGGGDGLMSRLLPLLAPLVMSWLARSVTGAGDDTGSTGGSGGGLEELLGGLLQSELGGGGDAGGMGGFEDLLGGLLGGGTR